jgi:hypothetical protein
MNMRHSQNEHLRITNMKDSNNVGLGEDSKKRPLKIRCDALLGRDVSTEKDYESCPSASLASLMLLHLNPAELINAAPAKATATISVSMKLEIYATSTPFYDSGGTVDSSCDAPPLRIEIGSTLGTLITSCLRCVFGRLLVPLTQQWRLREFR